MDIRAAALEAGYGFEAATDSCDLAGVFVALRDELAGRLADAGGVELMRSYSDVTDALIRRIYSVAALQAEAENPSARRKASREVCMVAVGGYGRREMSPYSDVDITFVVGDVDDDEVEAVVKRAFRILMDVLDQSGVKVGYSYRRVDDVENLPLETQTALLDARWIVGSMAVMAAFRSALRAAIAPAAFVLDHIRQRDIRGPHKDTPYLVEPDLKEGRGGLRDLHTARWIAQVAYDLEGERVWEGLRARGVLLDSEITAVGRAIEFIARTRNAAHVLSGRAQDVLTASRHAAIAAMLGFGDASESSARAFIAAFYSHSRELWRIYHKVAEACTGQELDIEPGLVAKAGNLIITDRSLLVRDGAALVRLFRYTQCCGLKIHRQADELIAAAAESYKLTPAACRSFLDILSDPSAADSVRAMADLGVLQSIIPGFAELIVHIPGDSAHRFTVGEHSLRTVEHLSRLFFEHDEQLVDIFSRVQNLDVLFLAALLHDIGKLDLKRDHSRSGAARARKTAATLGMSEEDCGRVEFLVRNHLKMGETARLRDLHQRKTIRDFASLVKDQQLLDMLFLLTVADHRAVGSANWSRVQLRFLLELHERTVGALRSPRSEGPDIERHRSRVMRELRLANLPPDEVDEHCASTPASYLLNTPPDDLAVHIGFVRTVRSGSPAVEIKDDRLGQFTLLTVAATDKRGLLSDLTGVLHAMNIDVHAAQIFTRRSSVDDIAIDILYIDYEGRQLSETKKWQLEAGLLDVLGGVVTMDSYLAQWGKGPLGRVENVSVRVLDNLSDHETVIEVKGPDVPGILYYLTSCIADYGLSIHSARVATWGYEAHDVFYVTGQDGGKLSDVDAAGLEAAISAVLPRPQ